MKQKDSVFISPDSIDELAPTVAPAEQQTIQEHHEGVRGVKMPAIEGCHRFQIE